MKSGAGQCHHVGDKMVKKVPGPESLNLGVGNTKIGGFGGSVVCDRIVKLVLGDVGLEF